MNTHLHVTSWVLAFILLAIVVVLNKQGKAKGAKITHMVLRLDYLLILYSGGALLAHYFNGAMLTEAIIKSIAGIWVIAAMEMIGIRGSKGVSTKGAWIQFVIAVLLTLILGFARLPGGFM